MNINPKKITSAFIVLMGISAVNNWTKLPIGNTVFWWIVYSVMLLSFLRIQKYLNRSEEQSQIVVLKLLLFWNIICIFRGAFIAENYWEWKSLCSSGMVLLLPIIINSSRNKFFVQYIFQSYLRYTLPLFFVLFFFIYGDAVGHFLAPISIFLLFFWDIPTKWKIPIVFLLGVVLASDITARSNIIKFLVPVLLSLILLLPAHLLKAAKFFRNIWFMLMVLPVIFLILGVSGIFDVFKIDKYITGNYQVVKVDKGEKFEENLKEDTRTFLYVEVIQSALKNNYVLFGRTPARGNDSNSFGSQLSELLKTGKKERFENEVSILNIFTWTGLVGVILYMLVFFRATDLAVNSSNNIYMKIIGLYVSFRWVYAWVEDFSRFDLFYCALWMLLGVCYSKSFRQMDNKEMKEWICQIFDRRVLRKIQHSSK